METINIAFLGGCINKQKGIPAHQLYHQLLKEKLQNSNVPTEVFTGSYLSYVTLDQCAVRLLQKSNANILVVYLRTFPLMPLLKPVVKYDTANGFKKMAFHPALFNRKHIIWPEQYTAFQANEEYVFSNRKRFELRDLNLLCGLTIGLNKWAQSFIEQKISAIKTICDKEGIALVLISPTKNPESIVGNYICKRTTEHFSKYCTTNDIEYVDLNNIPITCFQKDGVHINEQAHAILSKRLFKQLQPTLSTNQVLQYT